MDDGNVPSLNLEYGNVSGADGILVVIGQHE